jgi:hypothetical protein
MAPRLTLHKTKRFDDPSQALYTVLAIAQFAETMAEGGICQDNQVVSLEEQLSRFPTELLDCACAESHLGKLVHMVDVKSVVLLAAHIQLLPAEIDGIRSTWPKMSAIERLDIFKTWHKNKTKPTYRYVYIES